MLEVSLIQSIYNIASMKKYSDHGNANDGWPWEHLNVVNTPHLAMKLNV